MFAISDVFIDQSGVKNHSTINQSGDFNLIEVLQSGANNGSFIDQSGTGHFIKVSQSGDFNVSTVMQSGYANTAIVNQ
nr:hypothetical protein [Pseudemcibacter aquimaris]